MTKANRLARAAFLTAVLIAACSTTETLAQIQPPSLANPSWSVVMPTKQRFVVLSAFDDQAVLDRETGLVWERAPFCDDPPNGCRFIDFYFQAAQQCANRVVGNRLGWRLPSLPELLSLIDPTTGGLPAGHPFDGRIGTGDGILRSKFWSSTFLLGDTTSSGFGWAADFGADGSQARPFATLLGRNNSANNVFAWCVRTGSGSDTN